MIVTRVFIFTALATVAIEAASVSNADMAEWKLYKKQYGKHYENEKEEEFRRQVYLNSSREVKEHQKLYAEGKFTYQIGINSFSDLLQEEFEEMMHMNDDQDLTNDEDRCELQRFNASTKLSDSWDWRNKGAVGPVKCQKEYGNCWAFSAVGALEGHHFLKTKKFVSLSEQNLVDCMVHHHPGGSAAFGFLLVEAKGGIESNESYPYTGPVGECRYRRKNSVENIKGCRRVISNNEEQLKIAVEKVGPIAVSFYSHVTKFQKYKEGIIYDEECLNAIGTTHAVVLVGFGTENGTDYWLLKNSYGEGWGDNGYFKIIRNNNSHCLIASKPTYPEG